MARAVKPSKKVTDRRRPGVGDNSRFTVHPGAGGLGVGERISNVVSPTLAQRQYTNRGTERKAANGKSAAKKPVQNPQGKKVK